MGKNVFVANSAYSLLLYLLKHTDKIDSTLFILGPSVHAAKVPNKIRILLPENELLRAKEMELTLDKIESLGFDFKAYVNAQSIGDKWADRLAEKYEVTALSDGLSDFQNFPKYMATGRFDSYYRVTGADETEYLPDCPDLETDDLKQLWLSRSDLERLKIVGVFNVDAEDIKLLRNKAVIVVTQPLSEDGIMSELQKRRFYADIISNYNQKDIVIKPHPREETNWQEMFKTVPVISSRVPMELLALMVPVQKLVTFYSTAGTNIVPPYKVDFYAKGFENLSFVHSENPLMGRTPYVNIEEKLKNRAFNWCYVPNKSNIWYCTSITRRSLCKPKDDSRQNV